MAKRKTAPTALSKSSDPNERTARERGITSHREIMNATTEGEVVGDLRLSPIEYRDPRTLKPSPHNAVFDELKTTDYWANLRRDIEDAGAITDPLVVEENGTILSGHSRQRVSVELLREGRREFEKVPVRVVLSDLTDDEKRNRVYLGNLSRFEIDPDTRLSLYARIYPEYFNETRKRGQQTETVSVSTIAGTLGVSDRQVRNERAVYQDAKKTAATKGKTAPDRDDIAKARKRRNAERKAQGKRRPPVPESDAKVVPEAPVKQGENRERRRFINLDGEEYVFLDDPETLDALERYAGIAEREIVESFRQAKDAGTGDGAPPWFYIGVATALQRLIDRGILSRSLSEATEILHELRNRGER